MKKIVFITAYLVEAPEAHADKSNTTLEEEISAEMHRIPYIANVEKVTVLDCPT
jgi:hypothetical protein